MQILIPIEEFQNNLFEWFSECGRHWIPWKLRKDGSFPESGEFISPYGIWIAEVMLQQTQLQTVIPYWEKWMKTFPTLIEVVEADEQKVLMQWQGLGYYSRAKRLHQSSKLLIEFTGKDNFLDPFAWPVELNQWLSLPGIGKSTAGSIISSAFDLPSPILDGNIKRIFSRLLATKNTPSKDQKTLWKMSSLLLSKKRPRDFNQALMDLGAKICTPQKPSCSCCPLQNYCVAYIKYDPHDFPKKEMKKIKTLQEIGIGLVFNKNGELLIDQRLETSNMGGMWEFPGGKKNPDEFIEDTIARELKEELGIVVKVGAKLLSFDHAYTNKRLYFTVHFCEWISGQPRPLASQKILWVSPEKLLDFPFPSANIKIISELHKQLSFRNKKL